jgi:hypothetical protein
MICVTLKNYQRGCGSVSGGISDILVFDPSDFDFTQAAATGGALPPYTAMALQTGATGKPIQQISFQQDEAEWKWTQSVKGCSVKYDHEFDFQLAENGQTLTTFLQALDAASCCCGLGMIIRMNNGKIFVAGEKFVNGSSTIRFQIKNDGSSGGSGKLIDDFNGGNIVLKGSSSRNLYEFSGDWADVEAFIAAA